MGLDKNAELYTQGLLADLKCLAGIQAHRNGPTVSAGAFQSAVMVESY
jgi:hypothetical protein